MGIKSRVCDILGIEQPIILAGMGGASTPKLAAAVSNAGGLGVLGAAACGPNELRQWIRETRSLTDKPFGVDTLLPASVRRQTMEGDNGPSPADKIPEYKEFARDFMKKEGLEPVSAPPPTGTERENVMTFSKEFFEAQMDVVCDEAVPVYAAGLGSPGPWMDRLRANGTKVMGVVGAVRHAVQLASSGLDIIVAQGHDGGGHNSPIGAMALIPAVVDAVGPDIPILGAGGISDGRGVAAAMMLGAEGAWIGTRFLATEESGIHDFQKEAIVDGNEEGTVVSRSVTGKPARLIRNKWADAFARADIEPLPMPFQSAVAGPVLAAAAAARRGDVTPGFAGQGIALIKSVEPAKDVFEKIVAETEEALARAKALG
jgi:NAD(P)H-dependent flavin oxidoreductase YrpB (nitropropane dioxygenase family)